MNTETETLRAELATLYRLLDYFRMTDLIYTHVSVRLPGQGHRFLINEYGRLFGHMRPEDLVEVDAEGRPCRGEGEKEVNPAGFTIHSAIHMARPDVTCVVHTHTSAGIAVAAQKEGLLPISQHALKFYGHLAYHEYEGIALELDERERLVADLGSHNAMVLRNHGLLVCGRTVSEAFYNIYYLERACQAQVAALVGGRALVYPSEATRLKTAEQFQSTPERRLIAADRAWKSAVQLLPSSIL
ncbi:class II aldolase/adducin family protein [bacterium BD-1]|nr:class II aldolase/adducin family protein [Ottowia caeni]